jgi:DHA1 family bicyclomycin/chloramphenicol resistance-like MFS transporter
MIHSFSYGLVAPNAQQRALQPLGYVAGAAAALLSSLTMLFGALGGMLVSHFFPTLHILAVTGAMCIFCSLSLSVYVFMVKKKLVVDDMGEA